MHVEQDISLYTFLEIDDKSSVDNRTPFLIKVKESTVYAQATIECCIQQAEKDSYASRVVLKTKNHI